MSDLQTPPIGIDGFGLWVRRRRTGLLLTQEELAERSGVSVRALRDVESGRTRYSRADTQRLLIAALTESQKIASARLGDSAIPNAAWGRDSPRPMQLPSGVAVFTGRREQLRQMDQVCDSAGLRHTVATLMGAPGVGKTALAIHWAHRMRETFSDGQLYVDLRGFHPTAPPMDPADALLGFLDALGLPDDRIPRALADRVGLYRSVLADRRVLVILDNAWNCEQVRPLLPTTAESMAVVTSRDQLAGLVAHDGAQPVAVPPCTPAEGHQILAARLGTGRTTAELDAVDEIVALCAGLPLALAVVAARAALHPDAPLAELAKELRCSEDRLDMLSCGEPSSDVRSVMSWSYRALGDSAAELFRTLGLSALLEFEADVAACATGWPTRRVRAAFAELVRCGLALETVPGRLALHDLLQLYARELAQELDRGSGWQEKVTRIREHYLSMSRVAADLLRPRVRRATVPPAQPEVRPERLRTDWHAVAWFNTEYRNVLALLEDTDRDRADRTTWSLAVALSTFMERQGRWNDLVEVGQLALAASVRLDEPTRHLAALRMLGRAHTWLGRHDLAADWLSRALQISHTLDDRTTQAAILFEMSILHDAQGRHAESLQQASAALDLYRQGGDHTGEASALNTIGWNHIHLNDPWSALDPCRAGLVLHQRIGNRHGEAATWDSLGLANETLGRHDEAVASYRRGLHLVVQTGDRHLEFTLLDHLGATYQSAGQARRAAGVWQRALTVLDGVDHPQDGGVRGRILSTLQSTGNASMVAD